MSESSHSLNILVLDDNMQITRVVRKMLAQLKHNSIEFNIPGDAIDYYRNHFRDVDLIISDIMMPHFDGIDFYNKLKMINEDIKIIFISGYTKTNDFRVLNTIDNCIFIPKPFKLSDIERGIDSLL
ncbi:MAG: response regulator [bacterium]